MRRRQDEKEDNGEGLCHDGHDDVDAADEHGDVVKDDRCYLGLEVEEEEEAAAVAGADGDLPSSCRASPIAAVIIMTPNSWWLLALLMFFLSRLF